MQPLLRFYALIYVFLTLILLDFTFFLIFSFLPILNVFCFCRIISLLTVHISHFWRSTRGTIVDNIKILTDLDYGFNGFDTIFSKNLIELFNLVYNSCFYCNFSSMKYPLQGPFLIAFHGTTDEPIF